MMSHPEVRSMKRMFVLICVLAITGGSIGAFAAPSPVQKEIDALMAKWRWAISNEFVDEYIKCYWPEITDQAYDNQGQPSILTGLEAMRQRQQEWSDTLDMSKMDMNYPEPLRFIPASGDIVVYQYVLKQFSEMEIFYFQRRGGEYRILRQIDLFYQN
jgi:hypothetical protein